MKNFRKFLFLAGALALFGTSCDKEEGLDSEQYTEEAPLGLYKYVVTVTPIGTTGIADILLTSDYLDRGSITTAGNGLEQDGSYRYYLSHKGRFFSLLYGQGNPGAVTTYRINTSGKLVKATDFQTETVQVFTKVNDELLLMKVPRSGTETCNLYRIDGLKSRIVGNDSINIVKLAANGERAHFTWATQVGDKVYAPYMSIKGCCADAFGTVYPDSTWVAVLSYPGLKLEKVIRDNRTSYLGAYFNNGLSVTEKGDVYGFSPAAATNTGKYISKNPSAIVRILKNTTEFDKNYFFNVQEKSGGYHIAAQTYLSGGKFLLAMYGAPNAFPATRKMALVDVESQSFTWVKGMPDEILSITAPYNNNTVSEDGNTGYIGLNTTSGSWVYTIDIATATAKKGLTVEGGRITAITKVDY